MVSLTGRWRGWWWLDFLTDQDQDPKTHAVPCWVVTAGAHKVGWMFCPGHEPMLGYSQHHNSCPPTEQHLVCLNWPLAPCPGPVFYLLSWSPSHLEFFLQVTWSFSIFTPSDLEAKSLGEIPSDFGCWLGDILDHFNIVICILYLSKLI